MKLMQSFSSFFRVVLQNRRLLLKLATNEIKSRYLGSALGSLWAVLQPLITILIYWFVFEMGFRVSPMENIPYILWFLAGMIPWFFINDSINLSLTSVTSNAYLVKKIVFPVSILPITKILAQFIVHVILLFITVIIYLLYGYPLDVYMLQLPYYALCIWVLVLGIGWLISSLSVFSKDVAQIVIVAMQFLFWLTPIFWSFKQVPQEFEFLFKLNPLFYIIDGYRNCFINQMWAWERPLLAAGFWLETFCIFFVGVFVFKKLRPQFADVL